MFIEFINIDPIIDDLFNLINHLINLMQVIST